MRDSEVRDSEVVASIVAGDPDGLATAYDKYADLLYTYCRSVLRDPADAADAVQDTFVIAASRLEGLRDPDKLRSWLYTVARNECMRILRANKDTWALDEAPDVIDESIDVSAGAEHAELRTLFRDASGGLNDSEREVIELSLRHKMEAGEIADVLGVSKNHAHSLLSRARAQMETCLGALLVGRTGRDECKELGSLLGEWDGRLTVLLRKRLHRHIEHCSTCTKRRAFELRPAAFLGLPPLVAIAGALRWLTVPGALKGKVLALATGTGTAAAAHRAAVGHRAGSFGHQGFPHVVHGAKAGVAHGAGAKAGAFLKTPQGQGTAAAVILAVIAASTAFALTASNTGHVALAGAKPGSGSGAGAGTGGSHSSSTSGHGPGHGSGGGAGSAPAGSQPHRTATAGSGPASGSSAPSGPGTTPPGSPSPAQGSSSPSSSPSLAPAPSGTLTASPSGGFVIIPPGGTTITLTNSGSAQAHWDMTVSGGSGTVRVSPSSGSLAPGKSATVRVTTPSSTAAGQTIALAPGGTTWAVLLGWNNPGTGSSGSGLPGLPGTGAPLPSPLAVSAVPDAPGAASAAATRASQAAAAPEAITSATPAYATTPAASTLLPTCAVYAILPTSAQAIMGNICFVQL